MAQTNRNQKEDLRQRRTRRRLVSALLELLEEQPFQSLSVVDICERAMVHRTTFYTHFKDKQALLCYAIQMLLQEFDFYSPDMGGASAHAFFLAVAHRALAFLGLHRKLFQAGLRAQDGVEFHALKSVLAEGLAQRMRQLSHEPGISDLDPEITAHFYAGAMVGLIHWWAEHDMPVSEETLIRHLDQFLPGDQVVLEKG